MTRLSKERLAEIANGPRIRGTTREVEQKILKLAEDMIKDRNDDVQILFGQAPGWFFWRRPQNKPLAGMTVGDVYLYSIDVYERFTVTCVHGTNGLEEKLMAETLAFQVGYEALKHGASSVEFRPMDELESS